MFETLLGFLGSGMGFWVVLTITAILLTSFSEEEGVWATVTLVVGALFLQFVAKYDLIGLIRGQPMTMLVYVGLYAAIGLVWAVVKWWFYAKKQRRIYDRLRTKFFRDNGLRGDEIPTHKKSAWFDTLDRLYQPNNREYGFRHYVSEGANPIISDIRQNKAAFIRWMTYWPFSVAFTLLNDPVRRLFEFLYELVGKKMQEIANHVFSGTERDLPGGSPPEKESGVTVEM